MCTNAPSTVDYETDNRGRYLGELDVCLKRFNGALTTTMNSYRDLLSAFDKMAQVYGNLAGNLKPEVKEPIVAFRDGMRDLKDKGPFVTFNADIHEGTINILDPLRVDLKKAQKSLSDLKSKQKDYDNLRAKIEKKEKEYAKKDKPLSSSESYRKESEQLSKSKLVYESKRDSFEHEVLDLKSTTETILLQSMNNYLHCTASFAGYIETTMNMYRTDLDENGKSTGTREIRLDRARQEAERRSATHRWKNNNAAAAKDRTSPSIPPPPPPQPSAPNPSDVPSRVPTSPQHSTTRLSSQGPATLPGGSAVQTEDFAPMNSVLQSRDGMYPSENSPSAAARRSVVSNQNNKSASMGNDSRRASAKDGGRYSPDDGSGLNVAEDDINRNEGGETEYPSENARNPLSNSE